MTKKLQPTGYTVPARPSTECDEPHHFTTDFYVLGRSWLNGLSIVLVGARMPIVTGAPKDDTKRSDGKKKLEELDLYEPPPEKPSDPSTKCSDRKFLRELLTPYMSKCRTTTTGCFSTVTSAGKETFNELKEDVISGKNRAITWLRSDENLNERRAIVAGTGLLAYIWPLRKGLMKRFIHVTGGLLASGALCFPSETDEYFRKACGIVHNFFKAIYDMGKE